MSSADGDLEVRHAEHIYGGVAIGRARTLFCGRDNNWCVMDKFTSKLKDLGFELPHWCEPPSEQLVARFERRFSVHLPSDYRAFLVQHGGVVGNALCPVQEPTPFGTEACID
jgi:hypothetical protein